MDEDTAGDENMVSRAVLEGLIVAQVLASVKKLSTGLRYAASGQHQDYPPGTLELGVALDALNMFASDMLNLIGDDLHFT